MPRESRGVQDMLHGADHMRNASWKFRKGDTAAPEAEVARTQMRKEELRRVEGNEVKAKKKPVPQFSGRETEEWREYYKKKEINWPAEARWQTAEKYKESLKLELRLKEKELENLYTRSRELKSSLERSGYLPLRWEKGSWQSRVEDERLKLDATIGRREQEVKRLIGKIRNYEEGFKALLQKQIAERYRTAVDVDKPGSVHEELADRVEEDLGRLSQEEMRRVGKMEKDSRAPRGPLKKLVEEDKTWVQIKKGERPVQKPRYKTEEEELRPARRERKEDGGQQLVA